MDDAKLTIELVPSGQWGANLRSELPKKRWDQLRKATYSSSGYVCEVCGGRGERWPVECHERWNYDEKNKSQILIGLISLCPPCHEVKHMGRANAMGRGEQAKSHLMKVNGWTDQIADAYIENAFRVWLRRSSENWSLDISWLEDQ